MSFDSDPSIHRQREKLVLDHVQQLLQDDRLRIDTTMGRWSIVTVQRDVQRRDREVDLKRLMSEMGLPDRQLQARMPPGGELDVHLSTRRFFFFKSAIGQLKVVCLPPWRALLEGNAPGEVDSSDLASALAQHAPGGGVPTTVVAVSTSGFTREAHALAQRTPGRTVILIEPNDAGGWTVTVPPDSPGVAELFDPEETQTKRARVQEQIERQRADLVTGGISAERLAARTQLPVRLVEEELKSYAANGAGLVARRLGGTMVLFREGSPSASPAAGLGGAPMPFVQRVKALFGMKGDNEKKVALLSERRTTLTIQRDLAFDELDVLESREQELRGQFKASASTLAKKRITSQLVQLRKDAERRQQLMGVLNQQIDVISTHLHNLELVQQGKAAQLPDAEELAGDAAAAEEVLAELQANSELAASVAASGPTSLSEEEQALYEELEKEAQDAAKAAPEQAPAAKPAIAQPQKAEPEPEIAPPPLPPQRQRGQAEPG